MQLASGLNCFFFNIWEQYSYNGNKELVELSVVLASVLQWAKLCDNFRLNCRLSEEMQVLQEIAA